MSKTKISKDNLIKVFDYINCNNGVSTAEITKFMGWTHVSTLAVLKELIAQNDVTEIVLREPAVIKDTKDIKGYIVE